MSRKVQTFARIITNPLNIHNFTIIIPEIDFTSVIESTTFPTERFRIIELWANGEKVRYPGIPENDGTWKFKIPENDDGIIQRQFENLKKSMWNQATGIMTPTIWKTVQVIARDLNEREVFSVKLHGAWLQGRDQVNLAANDPQSSWKWDYQFVYNWIEDVDKNKQNDFKPL